MSFHPFPARFFDPARPHAVRRWVGAGTFLAGVVALSGCVVAPVPASAPPPVVRVQPVPQPMVVAPAPVVRPQGEPLYFYPQRQQSAEQQDRDRYECYRWAVRQTGVDPGMRPVQKVDADAPPPTVARDGSGAATGAVTGAVLGAAMSSPRHAGSGMVLGAIFGGLMGAAAQESQAQAIEREWQAEQDRRLERQSRAHTQAQESFQRAMTACMVGRNYTVR